jgi:hypothetical protein
LNLSKLRSNTFLSSFTPDTGSIQSPFQAPCPETQVSKLLGVCVSDSSIIAPGISAPWSRDSNLPPCLAVAGVQVLPSSPEQGQKSHDILQLLLTIYISSSFQHTSECRLFLSLTAMSTCKTMILLSSYSFIWLER